MKDPSKPWIDLGWSEEQFIGLILLSPSGATYTNQVAGHACAHPEEQGFYVPMPERIGRPVSHALENHFRGSWHSLDSRDTKFLDRLFRRHDLPLKTKVDKLDCSFEAWVYVELLTARCDLFETSLNSGVFTWRNSD